MSEMVQVGDARVTIGSCEQLWYVRHADYKRLVESGVVKYLPGNDQPENYLNGLYMFRFPFPDEDGKLFHHGDFSKQIYLDMPPALRCGCGCYNIGIHAQKPLAGELVAVGTCGCNAVYRLDKSDAYSIAQYTLDRTTDPLMRKVCYRMMAGYTL